MALLKSRPSLAVGVSVASTAGRREKKERTSPVAMNSECIVNTYPLSSFTPGNSLRKGAPSSGSSRVCRRESHHAVRPHHGVSGKPCRTAFGLVYSGSRLSGNVVKYSKLSSLFALATSSGESFLSPERLMVVVALRDPSAETARTTAAMSAAVTQEAA